jgi:hypothetical protein
VNYPEQKVPMFLRFRGKQVLMRDENGLEKCGVRPVRRHARRTRSTEAAENDGSVQAGPATPRSTRSTRRGIFCGFAKSSSGRRDFMGKDRARGLQQGGFRLGQTRLARAGVLMPPGA